MVEFGRPARYSAPAPASRWRAVSSCGLRPPPRSLTLSSRSVRPESHPCPPPSPPSACPPTCARASTSSASPNPSPSRPPPSPTASPAATSAARRPRAPARPSPSASRCSLASSEPRRAGPRASCSCPPASSPRRCRSSCRRCAGAPRPRCSPSTAAPAWSGRCKALGKGVEIVVATPGRLKDLLDRGSLRLDDVNLVVIDEADRMADMGFLPEVRRLLDQTNAEAPDDAVLRHARRRRRRAHPPLPDQPRPPRGALDGGAGRGHPPLLGRVARRSHPGGHRHRRAVVAGHRVQPHPPRRRAPVEAAAEGRRPRRGHPRRPQPEPARAGPGAVRARRRARARRHRRRRPRHPRRRRRLRPAVRPAGHRQGLRPPLRPHRSRRRGGHGDHVRLPGEGEGRAQDAARAASPRADRGGDRRHRRVSVLGVGAAEADRPRRRPRRRQPPGAGPRPRSTACPTSVAAGPPVAARPTARAPARGRWPRPTGPPGAKPGKPAAAKRRNGQERAGAPTAKRSSSGRPGAKPGRRPAGAGAARPRPPRRRQRPRRRSDAEPAAPTKTRPASPARWR